MSKLAVIRQYRYSPAAGGLFSAIAKVGGGILKTVGGWLAPAASKAAQVATKVAKTPVGQAAILTAGSVAAQQLMSGGGGSSGASGSFGTRRRGRGITARELRGYRKVARLLHKEGMVSKRARGRH